MLFQLYQLWLMGELSAVLKYSSDFRQARVLNVMAMVSFGGVFAGALVTIELL